MELTMGTFPVALLRSQWALASIPGTCQAACALQPVERNFSGDLQPPVADSPETLDKCRYIGPVPGLLEPSLWGHGGTFAWLTCRKPDPGDRCIGGKFFLPLLHLKLLHLMWTT